MEFKKFNPDVKDPFKKYQWDVGYDLHSPGDYVIKPGNSETINLGIGFDIPVSYMGLIAERSSQGKISVSSNGNIVDPTYRGPVHVTLENSGHEDYVIKKDDRICQIIFVPVYRPVMKEVLELSPTDRGDQGYGSTGK